MQSRPFSLDALPESATLAESVFDAQGRMLLPEGAVLTTANVAGLQRRGIETVVAVVPSEAAAPASNDASVLREQVNARMQRLFRHALRGGQVNPLLHIASRYRMGERL